MKTKQMKTKQFRTHGESNDRQHSNRSIYISGQMIEYLLTMVVLFFLFLVILSLTEV